MDKIQASIFREAYGAAAQRYTRMTKAALHREYLALMADVGIEHLYGTFSKDELVAEVMSLRGYTIARWNESTHVTAHDVTWPDCEHCQARAEAERAEAAGAFVPTGTGWPVP